MFERSEFPNAVFHEKHRAPAGQGSWAHFLWFVSLLRDKEMNAPRGGATPQPSKNEPYPLLLLTKLWEITFSLSFLLIREKYFH